MTPRKPEQTLRKGWTTGACAAAATKAAWIAMLTGSFPNPVTIRLPRNNTPSFELKTQEIGEGWARAGIIKDAGDDPDVTHGAEIIARVETGKADQNLKFFAGKGVGTVTLPGLPLDVGEPAINPQPRQIIVDNLNPVARKFGVKPDLNITIEIPGGEELALKTMNSRLGIKGGLSVLGTTGVVVPYSCASWIHSIHRGIDVARATGLNHIAAATGSTSEAYLQARLPLPEQAFIDMGDFAGGLLKHIARNPVERLTLAGGFGKLSKLGNGQMDLHSSRSSVDMIKLAECATVAGADVTISARIANANTAMEALAISGEANLKLADIIAARARGVIMATLAGGTQVDVIIVDRAGQMVGQAGAPL